MKSIPFHSSVRIKLGAGQPIKDKNGDVIGINVSAKTIKNKVAPPFRTVRFQIHFGKGIFEHEELFDELRKHGEMTKDGKRFSVSGNGAWKLFSVVDDATGETITEKKFHKSSFDEVINDPEYAPYIDDLIEDCFVKRHVKPDEIDLDTESYEEVRSITLETSEELIDPEA